MIIEIPMTYQPAVGKVVDLHLSGRVLNVRVNPTLPSGSNCMVEIELDNGDNSMFSRSISHHDSRRNFSTVATGGGSG